MFALRFFSLAPWGEGWGEGSDVNNRCYLAARKLSPKNCTLRSHAKASAAAL